MPRCGSPASSSSLDESTRVLFEALRKREGMDRVGVAVEAFALLVGVAPIAEGEDLGAGEKLILVCRLRSRAVFAMIVAVKGALLRFALR